MRRRRSKWWWIAAIVITALVWRWCRSSDERVEATLHVKLAPGATREWAPPLDDATVLDSEPLFVRPETALAEDRVIGLQAQRTADARLERVAQRAGAGRPQRDRSCARRPART